MAHMYKEIPDAALENQKYGSIYYLLSGLPTINTILKHTLLPKYGDNRMIRGHSVNLLHMFDVPEKFEVMTLIVETIKRTATNQKRSCGYAPHIQMLIKSKMGKGMYLLDKEHHPLRPDCEESSSSRPPRLWLRPLPAATSPRCRPSSAPFPGRTAPSGHLQLGAHKVFDKTLARYVLLQLYIF